jgi:hypothetical protein
VSVYRRATVTEVRSRGAGIREADLEFESGSSGTAIVLEGLTGSVEVGDEVIANATAVDLGLGSGGYHFVLWNLSRDSLTVPSRGHIMKLRYTPLQFNVEAVEETAFGDGQDLDAGCALGGVPVVAGSLHSQLLPVALAYRTARPRGRLVYVMTDGGSLPMAFSDTVRFLKREGYLDATISCGHAFGGDYEAVSIYGALAAARLTCAADAVVAVMGPGIVGTGSSLGFSGMEQAAVVNAASSLGGRPVSVARITFSDERVRHRGLSHHTVSALGIGALARSVVGIPVMEGEKRELVMSQLDASGIGGAHDIREVDARGVLELIERCTFEPTVMGRSVSEEPEFFMAAGAAGMLAAEIEGDPW